jgi:tetratricopeptide (TPR) repeat protein
VRHSKILASLVSVALVAVAGVSGADVEEAQNEIAAVAREVGSVQTAIQKAQSMQLTVEQRLAGGEMLYRSGQLERAIVVFSEIIEGFPNTPSYPDAMWLRGETFYAAEDYLAARRDYKSLVDRGSEARFQPYLPKALARLVDVSLRLGDLQGLDEVFSKLNLVPPAMVDAGLSYAKGKAYYAKKDYPNAMSALQAVGPNTPYTHQARYFQAMVVMRQAQAAGPQNKAGRINYKPAIDAFKLVTDLPADTPAHRHVIDLAWMAIGRLAYESENFQLASEAYAKVGRESPEFDTMLYELAWVYVRLGDVQRAERALEVLSIADPDSQHLADGQLLRADLLLRAGAFDKALQLYQSTRETYDPMRQKVEDFLSSTTDIGVYYDKLVRQQADALDASDQLPPIALRWAREAEDGSLAFTIINDIGTCRKLIRESELLIEKLNAITTASNRVRAFPELLAGEQNAVGLLNRISRARVQLAKGLDGEEGDLAGDIGAAQKERRELMAAMEQLPVTSSDFDERDRIGVLQWNKVSQDLTIVNQQADQLQAVVNGLRRMLKEDAQRGVTRDPASVKRFNEEIDQNENKLKEIRELAATLRRAIDIGRAQVGLGDSRYQDDAKNRVRFRDALERETSLASQGQAGAGAQKYAQRIQPVLMSARQVEDQLVAAWNTLDAQVQQKVKDLQQQIDAEAANIDKYKKQLDDYDSDARDLVGRVAQRNFTYVRDKLRNIVLRADVGVTEQAWEVREEELERVRNLQNERTREQNLLDEELREVLDDGVDQAKK